MYPCLDAILFVSIFPIEFQFYYEAFLFKWSHWPRPFLPFYLILFTIKLLCSPLASIATGTQFRTISMQFANTRIVLVSLNVVKSAAMPTLAADICLKAIK